MFLRFSPRRSLFRTILIVILLIFIPTFLLLTKHQVPTFILEHPYFHYDLDSAEPRSFDQKCVLPRVHPFHPSVWSFLSPPKPIICKNRRYDLTYVDDEGYLKFNGSEVRNSGYNIGSSLHCYWSAVKRGGGDQNVDEAISYDKEDILPEDGVHLPVDIVRVVCRNFATIPVYEKLHAHVRNASDSIQRKVALKNPVNVLIFGLDSMSRLAFIRYLPLTYRYLTEDLNMTVFRGMDKVGDNTYPNLVALLTGHKAYGGGLPDESQGFDDWPLIWKNYSSAGYTTMWAEDLPDFALFNYLAKGFKRPPTLHYLRPFWLAVKESYLLKLSEHMCYGSSARHLLQLDYVRRFVSKYESMRIPYFGFSFLAELSHDYQSRIASADSDFRDFFQFLHDGGFLKNALLIVMSDHGHRFDPIRSTPVGHIEERMPFFAIRIPEGVSLRSQVSKNFLLNSGRLITPFDVHATLSDFLEWIVGSRPLGQSPAPAGTLGLSLFGNIPANRTCSSASIPVHYCVCETESSIPESDSRAKMAATATIVHINKMLQEGISDVLKHCAVLTIGAIRSAHLVKTEEDASDDNEQKVRVVIEAEPSKALFEATVLMQDDQYTVLGEISRINPYGDQSNCIKHAIMRKYCFCIDHSKNISTTSQL